MSAIIRHPLLPRQIPQSLLCQFKMGVFRRGQGILLNSLPLEQPIRASAMTAIFHPTLTAKIERKNMDWGTLGWPSPKREGKASPDGEGLQPLKGDEPAGLAAGGMSPFDLGGVMGIAFKYFWLTTVKRESLLNARARASISIINIHPVPNVLSTFLHDRSPANKVVVHGAKRAPLWLQEHAAKTHDIVGCCTRTWRRASNLQQRTAVRDEGKTLAAGAGVDAYSSRTRWAQ
ncbi:hypothetical protein K438DRAFT_1783538 [Mycena galopus ATCC 62051]|nr:hypothetical protein K438DRAFT_1783538 [Mycena galopus ATCC 62051]